MNNPCASCTVTQPSSMGSNSVQIAALSPANRTSRFSFCPTRPYVRLLALARRRRASFGFCRCEFRRVFSPLPESSSSPE